jgi:hypothetical protein
VGIAQRRIVRLLQPPDQVNRRAEEDRCRLVESGGADRVLCECGDPQCFERVALSEEEYEAVRSHPARFFVASGHEDLTAGEAVVEERGQWTVVEKRGEEREIVERSDPRATER